MEGYLLTLMCHEIAHCQPGLGLERSGNDAHIHDGVALGMRPLPTTRGVSVR